MMRGYFNGIDQYTRFNNHMNPEFMWIGMAFRVLIVVAVFILIIWLVKPLVNSKNTKEVQVNKTLEIIKERYARGEISKEEYDILYKNLV